MKGLLLTILSSLGLTLSSYAQQVKLETTDLTSTYKYSTTNLNPYGIHDPSVYWDTKSQKFYVFGSHYAGAKTSDLRNWTAVSSYYNKTYDKAFKSNPTHNVMRCLPGSTAQEEVELGSYDAAAFCSTYYETENISGVQWAPDVVWNPNMNKYCYYVSLNGDNWASVIVLMTSDNIEGPYTYQGPIVFGGFNGQTYTVNGESRSVDFKKTDLQVVLGNITSVPGRYLKQKSWGSFWPNCIDPCVIFDQSGEMWLSYGSWSGGIWMLKLDKNTGLRDYTYTYTGTASSISSQQTSDAYFGKLIAGGCYVSGEGSYIQHIGDYYYLFMSYGAFDPVGGYEMRIFRSENPDGPYKDAAGNVATYTKYLMNYGPNAATNKGMRIIGSYDQWGTQTLGQCAMGHNSACQDDKGRTFLVCHTKFTNGTAAHAMRVHQLFQNKFGWLVAAPFVFNGETVNDDSIAATQPWSASDIEGDYHVMLHPYKMDYANYAVSTPKTIHLSADGKVTGDYTGTWKYTDEGKSYFQIAIGGIVYNGVVTEQTIQGSNASYQTVTSTAKALCFSAICSASTSASCGVTIWGYKMQPQYAIAYNYQNNSSYFLKTNYASISANKTMMFDTSENVDVSWTSSDPTVLSDDGLYRSPAEDTSITLTARLDCGNYYWTNAYTAKVRAATEIAGDAFTGLVAYYDFNDKPTRNKYNTAQTASYGTSNSTTGKASALANCWERHGNVVHQYQGAQGSNSYTRMTNPLKDQNFDGFTVGLWVNLADTTDYYDDIWSFFDAYSSAANGPRLYLSEKSYVGFNDNNGNWFDINHPNTKLVKVIPQGSWHHITFTYSKENGYALYKDGSKYSSFNMKYTGSVAEADFDKSLVIDFVKSAKYFFLGLGSFWGSAEASFDDLMIYNRELPAEDVKCLYKLFDRDTDFSPEGAVSIQSLTDETVKSSVSTVYDLQGRKVLSPSKGLYIVNGKKIMYK